MRLFVLLFAAAILAVIGGVITLRSGEAENRVAFEIEEAEPSQGRRVIAKYGCGSCHVIPGIRSADGLVGPPLAKMGRRAYIAGNLPNTPENLIRWIMAPQEVEPGTAMPMMGVTEDDAKAIAAYLHSLR